MIETDFGWALAKMRDGYKVRRPVFGAAYLWMPEDHTEVRSNTGAMLRYFNAADVLAYDWELADAA